MRRFIRSIALGVALGGTIAAAPAFAPEASAEPAAATVEQQDAAADAATIAQLAAAGIEVRRQDAAPANIPYLPATIRLGEVYCPNPGHGAFSEGVLYSQANAQGNTQGINFCWNGPCDARGYSKNLVEMGGPWWGGGIRSLWWNAYGNCPHMYFIWKGPGQTEWITSRFRNGPYVVNVWAGYPTQIRLVGYYSG
jgi:hypothetical protein